MILIISEEEDFSTNDVIEWLNFYGKKWIRVHPDDNVEVMVTISNGALEIIFEVSNLKFKLSEIESYWYRRGDLNFNVKLSAEILESPFQKEIELNVLGELKDLKDYIHYGLSKKKGINNKLSAITNKLINLELASQFGLNIPKTGIAQTASFISSFFGENEIITKPINESMVFFSKQGVIQSYTSVVKKLDDFKFPSLFQQSIKKQFEVRAFFFDNEFYSMAIFSQNDEQTKTDFRKYNYSRPNRTVPFKLPSEIEDKLRDLARKIDIHSGSFDLIVSEENEYIFLEVNPVGQFGMVSYPCRYEIEKKIAQYL